MSAPTTARRPASPTPRWSLTLACVVHAGALGWAGIALPSKAAAPLALGALGLAAGHVVLAALTAAGIGAAARFWRGLAVASLLFLAFYAWQALTAASYVATLYDGLGRGIVSLALISLAPLALFTAPFGFWGLAAAGSWPANRRIAVTAVALASCAILGSWRAAAAARPQPLPVPDDPIGTVAAALPPRTQTRGAAGPAALDPEAPAHCRRAPGARAGEATAVLRYRSPLAVGGTRTACLQGPLSTLIAKITAELAGADRDAPVKIDWIVGARPLSTAPAAVRRLALRPGLDGVCLDGRCLMPWQLVLADQFGSMTPIPAVRDFRFGVDPEALRRALGAPAGSGAEGLLAIDVESLVLDGEDEVVALRRMRPPAPLPTPESLAAAGGRIERHVRDAQADDGTYRYWIEPSGGESVGAGFSPTRQAGTTLVLCELAEDRAGAAAAARRSLANLARWEGFGGGPDRRAGQQAHLGPIALPLIAYLGCRDLVGSEFDPLIARLGGLLLSAQRPDGSFAPRIDLSTGAGLPGPPPLYAEGQAVFALTLLERELAGRPGQPPTETVRRAVERAMDRIAGAYWDHPLRDFFFLEENWHCLAARASLPHHRHDGYERFCLDYTAFRSRLQLDEDSGVDRDFIGGVGFGNLFPPHSVPSAGLGEVLAAAIAIKTARGEDASAERRRLRAVLDFLLRQQWSPIACFACAHPSRVVGGFSESSVSPALRIDYAQHAWAAIGHGAAALGKSPARTRP